MKKIKKLHNCPVCVCEDCIKYLYNNGNKEKRAWAANVSLELGYDLPISELQKNALLPAMKNKIKIKEYCKIMSIAKKLF